MRVLVFLTAGGAILINVAAFNHARAMLYFMQDGQRTKNPEALSLWEKTKTVIGGVSIPKPRARATPADFGMPFQEHAIPCINGIRLSAWHIPCDKPRAVVLFFHGYAADKSSLLTEAIAFREMGVSEFMVDFRGSGASSEAYTSVGYYEAEDVAETVRYVTSKLPRSKLILFGQSMGGAAVLRAISRHRVTPDAVILDSVFDTMLQTVRNRFESMGLPSFPCAELLLFWGGKQMGFDAFKHNPADYASSVSCPVLFLHGAHDPRVHLEQADRVFQAIAGPKARMEFPEGEHDFHAARFPNEWRKAVSSFLNRNSLTGQSTL